MQSHLFHGAGFFPLLPFQVIKECSESGDLFSLFSLPLFQPLLGLRQLLCKTLPFFIQLERGREKEMSRVGVYSYGVESLELLTGR